MFGKKKGQATIEYLVLLAVAIIIALVIFAFMGWIPGFAGSLKERQVKLYWSSQYPIQVREYSYTNSTGNLSLYLQNVADYQINITGISTSVGSYNIINGSVVLPGESKLVNFNLNYNCQPGSPFEFTSVKIYYKIIDSGMDMVEVGDRPFVGTCQ
ncbi:MAG: hypothetical protein QXH18_03240 [Candidatus Micrarchaeia archaeon]